MAELSPEQKKKLVEALKKHYKADVLSAKGGFFIKGKGFITLTNARKITGIKSIVKRTPRGKTGGYGDYAIIRKIAGRM